MHHRLWSQPRQSVGRRLSIGQIALDKFCPWINRVAMSLTQVIKNGDVVLLIEQHLRANAADVTGAADNENFHRGAILPISPAELKFAISQLRRFFLARECEEHPARGTMFSPRR